LYDADTRLQIDYLICFWANVDKDEIVKHRLDGGLSNKNDQNPWEKCIMYLCYQQDLQKKVELNNFVVEKIKHKVNW